MEAEGKIMDDPVLGRMFQGSDKQSNLYVMLEKHHSALRNPNGRLALDSFSD